nr:SJCHGC03617 protein [Schistosoma japonicum]
MIFQMNNIQYILKSIYKTNIHRYLLSQDREAVAKFTSIMDERKLFYSRWCARMLSLPDSNLLNRLAGMINRSIDQKEKSSLKSLWNDFNNGLNTLTKQHHLVSIPDRELRHSLEHQLVRDLVPMYRGFWEKSTSITFTTNRDKYIKLSVEEFEMRIRQLFNNGTTNSTR